MNGFCLTLMRMAIWPLLTRMAKECYAHGAVDIFWHILRPLSAAEDSCILGPPAPSHVSLRDCLIMLRNTRPPPCGGETRTYVSSASLKRGVPYAPPHPIACAIAWYALGRGGEARFMSPQPPQMAVMSPRSRGRILRPSSEAEDTHILVFWRFLFRLKNAATRWFYEVKNVCV